MVLVTRVKNHEQHKLELLKRINKYEADENMRWDHYYGDYQVSPFVEQSEAPEYMKYFYDNMAQDILRSVGNKLGLGLYNAEVHKLWYQRYEKKDFHDFHIETYDFAIPPIDSTGQHCCRRLQRIPQDSSDTPRILLTE